jgi:hypothetical protein
MFRPGFASQCVSLAWLADHKPTSGQQQCPLFPQERTFVKAAVTSVLCHEQTLLLPPPLFLVSVKLNSALVTIPLQPLRLVAE